MKYAIILILFLTVGISASYSQCEPKHEQILETHKKQCQACYKKLKYYYVKSKIYWGNCSSQGSYANKIKCMNQIVQAGAYLQLIGVDEVLRLKEVAESRCTETRGGQHLWKEIDLTSENLMEYQKINNLKDDYWCDLLDKNYNVESLVGMKMMIAVIEALNEL
jgi:hypothetical protein